MNDFELMKSFFIKQQDKSDKIINELRLFKPIQEDEEETDDEMLDGLDEPEGETDAPEDEMMQDDEAELSDEEMDSQEEVGEEEIELDISELVNGIKTTNKNIVNLNTKYELQNKSLKDINNRFDELLRANKEVEKKMKDMEEGLINQMKLRNPTPQEAALRNFNPQDYPFKVKPEEYFFSSPNDRKIPDSIASARFKMDKSDDNEYKKDEEGRTYVITKKDLDELTNQSFMNVQKENSLHSSDKYRYEMLKDIRRKHGY